MPASDDGPGRKRRSAQPGETPTFVYDGFPESNTTPVPDEFFDIIAPQLGEAELRVALYVIRRTRGFKKSEDAIAFSQLVNGITTRDGRVLDKGTGMAKSAVARAINGLLLKGVLVKKTRQTAAGDSDTNVYRLKFRGEGVVLQKDNPSPCQGPPVVLDKDTQDSGLQETGRQQTDSENPSSLSALSGSTHSEFRRARAQFVQEERQPVVAASRPLPAQPVASTAPPPSGMTRISQVLQAKGALQARGTTQARPTTSRTVATPNTRASQAPHPTGGEGGDATAANATVGRPQRSKRLARSTASDPDYPNTITEDELAAQEAERQSRSGPPPLYIDNVIDDIAGKLIKDLSEAASHRTQARNIWQASGLDVQAFVAVLYDARDRVRVKTGVDNKMGYFFKTVRVLVGLDENPNPPENRPAPKERRRSAAAGSQGAAGEERKSLAGKYAHLVRR